MRWSDTTCDSLQISFVCVRLYSITLYTVWLCVGWHLFICGLCASVCGCLCERDKEFRFCWICHSRVSLSVLLSEVCCDWSELDVTNSSFLSASSSVPPLARAPWMPFLSSDFSCRLSRMKPGMQMMKEIVRRLRVRPRYAILLKEIISYLKYNYAKIRCFQLNIRWDMRL